MNFNVHVGLLHLDWWVDIYDEGERELEVTEQSHVSVFDKAGSDQHTPVATLLTSPPVDPAEI